jgi:hypothetical protein
VTPKAFRALALALPEATEQPHFERASFRVGKKIFATMTEDGAEAMVRVKPPKRLQALLAARPDVFFDYGGWTVRNGALGVRLGAVDATLRREIATLLRDAWADVLPKRAPLRARR